MNGDAVEFVRQLGTENNIWIIQFKIAVKGHALHQTKYVFGHTRTNGKQTLLALFNFSDIIAGTPWHCDP